jgi:transcriptional regulator with XRE-family HTH domain
MATEPAIGTRIKRARERLRWTQRRLAEAVGVSQKTIDNWENGRTEPKSAIGALEDVLGVRLDGTPGIPEEAPTPGELKDLRDNIRETLPPERAARMLAALDAEYPGQR